MAWSERKQEVTGLTTNERVNVGRWFVRELDSIIHIWRRYGPAAAASCYSRRHKIPPPRATPARLFNFLRGKLSYLRMVKGEHDPICRRLQWELADLHASDTPVPLSLSDLRPTPVRGNLGRFRGWRSVTNQYVDSVKFLEIKVGEDLRQGTAFVLIQTWRLPLDTTPRPVQQGCMTGRQSSIPRVSTT